MPNNGLGDRILVASPGFADYTDAAFSSDFVLANLIPDSYLDAGRITYEGDEGTIYWLLGFGGSAYTGPTSGSNANDANGEFGPAFGGALPSTDLRALLFGGTALDLSTSNVTDYALTSGPAIFTNNSGVSAVVVPEPSMLSLFLVGTWMLASRKRVRRVHRTRLATLHAIR